MIGVALSWLKSHAKLLAALIGVLLFVVIGVLALNLRRARVELAMAVRDYAVERAARQAALDELRAEREARQKVKAAEDDLARAVGKNARDADAKRKTLDQAQAELDARVAARAARKSAAAEHNRRKVGRSP